MSTPSTFSNPFRPGAGHPPPYLAGREEEKTEFERLLQQDTLLENLVLTGLRGVGKTVLLDTFRPLAERARWLWVGTDLSESTSISEEIIALRLITDLAQVTSGLVVGQVPTRAIGFVAERPPQAVRLNFEVLSTLYRSEPGLVADKLKAVFNLAWAALQDAPGPVRGIIFAYDEAQNLADHAGKEQYPLSLLLDVFQSIQKRGVRFMLVLTGLPTLFPKLVNARTFAERMFRVLFLQKLNAAASRDAIVKPVSVSGCPIKLNKASVELIVSESGGYPYFIQFICREVYDIFLAQILTSGKVSSVPTETITRKLDADFFAGRWSRVTDRQRDLLHVIAKLPNCDDEFTVQDAVASAGVVLDKPFSSSHVSQMLVTLTDAGLVYKNRHGKYSFAVPLFGRFVLRQL